MKESQMSSFLDSDDHPWIDLTKVDVPNYNIGIYLGIYNYWVVGG